MLAERERRMREAEEAGKRQEEEARRAQHDVVFKQTMHVHRSTVETYLEDIILESEKQVADEQGITYLLKLQPIQHQYAIDFAGNIYLFSSSACARTCRTNQQSG